MWKTHDAKLYVWLYNCRGVAQVKRDNWQLIVIKDKYPFPYPASQLNSTS